MYNVLVVDDEYLLRWSLKNVLVKAGFAVAEAEGVEKAKSILCTSHVDIIITDKQMPDEDGLLFAQHVKNTFPDCRIVMITAYGTEAVKEQAQKIGIEHFIEKPLNMSELVWIVKKMVPKSNVN